MKWVRGHGGPSPHNRTRGLLCEVLLVRRGGSMMSLAAPWNRVKVLFGGFRIVSVVRDCLLFELAYEAMAS